MNAKLTACDFAISLALLGAFLLLGAGCGGPAHKAEEFVGVWMTQYEDGLPHPDRVGSLTLELRGDGLGTVTSNPDPHREEIVWFLKGGKLVFAPRGGGPTTYRTYRFNSPDVLVLTSEGHDFTLKRTPPPTPKP